jgi:hypothetical protein
MEITDALAGAEPRPGSGRRPADPRSGRRARGAAMVGTPVASRPRSDVPAPGRRRLRRVLPCRRGDRPRVRPRRAPRKAAPSRARGPACRWLNLQLRPWARRGPDDDPDPQLHRCGRSFLGDHRSGGPSAVRSPSPRPLPSLGDLRLLAGLVRRVCRPLWTAAPRTAQRRWRSALPAAPSRVSRWRSGGDREYGSWSCKDLGHPLGWSATTCCRDHFHDPMENEPEEQQPPRRRRRFFR